MEETKTTLQKMYKKIYEDHCKYNDEELEKLQKDWAAERGREIKSLLGDEDFDTVYKKCCRAGFNMTRIETHFVFDLKMEDDNFRKAVAFICAYNA